MLSCRRNESLPPRAAVGDLGEDRAAGAAREVRRRRPFDDLPPGRSPAPAHSPDADVLDAPRFRARPDDVVAHVGADEPRRPIRLDGGDQELGDRDLAQILDQPLELRGERAGVERRGPAVVLSLVSTSNGASPVNAVFSTGSRRPPRKSGASSHSATLAGRDGTRPKRVAELAEPCLQLPASRSAGNASLPGSRSFRNGSSVSGTASFGR